MSVNYKIYRNQRYDYGKLFSSFSYNTHLFSCSDLILFVVACFQFFFYSKNFVVNIGDFLKTWLMKIKTVLLLLLRSEQRVL